MGAINFNPSSLDGITTILAFAGGGLFVLGIFFAIIFNAWSKSKWKKYNQIDQRTLHRYGKRYVGKFHSSTVIPGTGEKKGSAKEYQVLIEYQADDGVVYRARPATFCDKMYAHRVKALKTKKKIPILAYKNVCAFDLDLDGSDGEGPIRMITPGDYFREYKKAFLIMPPPKHHPSEIDGDINN